MTTSKSQTALEQIRNETFRVLQNAYTSRQEWLTKLLDPRRDIDAECGHPSVLNIGDYHQLNDRNDVAARAVSIYPDETWSQDPEVFETEEDEKTPFEQVWDDLNLRFSFYSYLHRADVLSGIGRFGIILVGIDDGKKLDQPIDNIGDDEQPVNLDEKNKEPAHRLLYLRPLDESMVQIKSLETNLASPRYGKPLFYSITFADGASGAEGTLRSQEVHWTRVLHLCDNRGNSEVYGSPRLEKVANRIMDLRKIAGGSGEMFWKGGFPGLSIESVPNLSGVLDTISFDADTTKEQIESYMNGLQRYIATIGMQVKSLEVQVADPRPHVEVQMKMIATALGVPWRVFVGSEVGQLASEQDVITWNRRLTRRRHTYVTPFVIRPFIDRLLAAGVLPQPAQERGYQVFWPDLNAPSDEIKATVAEKTTNALAKYVESGASLLMDPFHYLTLVMHLNDEAARSVISASGEPLEGTEALLEEPKKPSQIGDGEE